MIKFSQPERPLAVTHIFMDFDGVLTDNSVYMDNAGNEMIRCSKWDSWAIALGKTKGYTFVIVSLENGTHVQQRASKLGIECHQHIGDKRMFLEFWCNDNTVDKSKCAYIGNDVADLGAMDYVGFSACPSDSHPLVIAKAAVTLQNRGGEGVIREFCDRFLVESILAP